MAAIRPIFQDHKNNDSDQCAKDDNSTEHRYQDNPPEIAFRAINSEESGKAARGFHFIDFDLPTGASFDLSAHNHRIKRRITRRVARVVSKERLLRFSSFSDSFEFGRRQLNCNVREIRNTTLNNDRRAQALDDDLCRGEVAVDDGLGRTRRNDECRGCYRGS